MFRKIRIWIPNQVKTAREEWLKPLEYLEFSHAGLESCGECGLAINAIAIRICRHHETSLQVFARAFKMSLLSKLFGAGGEHSKDSPELIKQNLASGKAVMLDVRGQDEWNDGHLNDAIFIPITELKALPAGTKAVDGLDKSRIVYCH